MGKLKMIYKHLIADLNNISTVKNKPFRHRTEFDYFMKLSPISSTKANVFIAKNSISTLDSLIQIF